MYIVSHPVWVRGLKLFLLSRSRSGRRVAPRVGAWIETSLQSGLCDYIGVAPRVGAWIETDYKSQIEAHFKSHPVWVRGLKRYFCEGLPRLPGRTPCGCVD